MIRKLSLAELIEAAANLDKPEQAILIAAIAGHAGNPHTRPEITLASEWAALANEGLERAYGDHEPEYSEADLVP